MKDQVVECVFFAGIECLFEDCAGGLFGVHGDGEIQSQQAPRVEVDEAGGITDQFAVAAEQVANIAGPDLVNTRKFESFDPVGEYKMAPDGSFGHKTPILNAKPVGQAKSLKTVFTPSVKSKTVLFMPLSDVKVHLAGTRTG